MILKMILKSFEFQCDFDFDFQITTSKMIWILILNHLYLGYLILILKSSTYDDFAHLCLYSLYFWHFIEYRLQKQTKKHLVYYSSKTIAEMQIETDIISLTEIQTSNLYNIWK